MSEIDKIILKNTVKSNIFETEKNSCSITSVNNNNFMNSNSINQGSYIQMSNLISGTTGNSSFLNNSNRSSFRSFVKNNVSNNSSDISTFGNNDAKSSLTKNFRIPPFGTLDDVGFIDDLTSQKSNSENSNKEPEHTNNNVYNFPWDIKLKSQVAPNLISSASSPSSQLTSSNSIQTNNKTTQSEKLDLKGIKENVNLIDSFKNQSENQDESQYCAPWDLKLQEEMIKMMAQKQQNQSKTSTMKSEKSNSISNDFENNNTSNFKRDDIKNSSTKHKNSIELIASSNETDSNKNLETPTDEYSPPWELKQSILLQNLATKQLTNSSSNSTLTSNNINQNINKNNNTNNNRSSPRSSTSSSSSTHSSTSSLSANSHSSMPPPPLPPQMPPPPPPPLTHSSLSSNSSSLISQHNIIQQSPRLGHRQTSQSNNGSNLITTHQINAITVLPSMSTNNSNSSIVNTNGTIIMTTNGQTLNSALLNDKNKFGSWGSIGSNMNPLETLPGNSFDDSVKLFRQSSTRSSNHQFVYPHHLTSNNQIISNEIQVAVPVTALVISNSSTLQSNILPITHQQLSTSSTISSTAHLNILERQLWYHGRITRKQAETVLSNKAVGSFLVRQSESGSANDFSLSLVSGSGCVHMRICLKNGEFILGQCSQPFPNILKMIEHYAKVEVPIKGAQHVKLKTPVSKTNEY